MIFLSRFVHHFPSSLRGFFPRMPLLPALHAVPYPPKSTSLGLLRIYLPAAPVDWTCGPGRAGEV
jgi:hypothetical protein